MSAGGTGYDIIVPTDATLVKMKHAELLEPLDLSLIPNVKNLDERFRNAAYDPGNKYSIPWQWGTTGIGYDKTKVDRRRHRLGRVRPAGGEGPERRTSTRRATRSRWRCSRLKKDPEHHRRRRPRRRHGLPHRPEEEDQVDHLRLPGPAQERRAPARAGVLGRRLHDPGRQPNIEYVIPTSGAFSWVDSMAIPKGAKHPGNAETFMNYILEPKVGAALTNFVNYGSPNKAAEPFIHKEILDNPLIYPSAEDAREAARSRRTSARTSSSTPTGGRRSRRLDPWPTSTRTFRAAAAGVEAANRNGGSSPTGSRGTCCCCPTSVWFIVPAGDPDAAHGRVQPGPTRRHRAHPLLVGQPHLVELPDALESRLPPDLHPLDRVRAGRDDCVRAPRVPARLLDRPLRGTLPQRLPRARDHPVPHELPDPHVRVAVHPAAQRLVELGARARSGSATTTRSSTRTSR